MQFRVDTEGMTFIAGMVRGVTEYGTETPKTDQQGRPLFDVEGMAVVAGERPEQMRVRVAGQPAGIGVGSLIRFTGLTGRTWEVEGKHGLSFSAIGVQLMGAGGTKPSDGKAA